MSERLGCRLCLAPTRRCVNPRSGWLKYCDRCRGFNGFGLVLSLSPSAVAKRVYRARVRAGFARVRFLAVAR